MRTELWYLRLIKQNKKFNCFCLFIVQFANRSFFFFFHSVHGICFPPLQWGDLIWKLTKLFLAFVGGWNLFVYKCFKCKVINQCQIPQQRSSSEQFGSHGLMKMSEIHDWNTLNLFPYIQLAFQFSAPWALYHLRFQVWTSTTFPCFPCFPLFCFTRSVSWVPNQLRKHCQSKQQPLREKMFKISGKGGEPWGDLINP